MDRGIIMKYIRAFIFLFSMTLFFSSCEEEEVTKDPVSELNSLVSEYGFIGFQNAMSRTDIGTHTGILVGGRPTGLAYVSGPQTCFPPGEDLRRYTDTANINKTYHYSYQGNFGILSLGIPILSAGLGLNKSTTVDIEINGLVIEYLDSIDVTDWYRGGMNPTCREYLNDVGFFIQTIHTDNMKLSVKRLGGTNIALNSDNIGNYFQFEAGVNWEIIDNYTVEITTPHTLGYQIALMKQDHNGRALYRAMQTKGDEFVFERIGFVASDPNELIEAASRGEEDSVPKLETELSEFID